MAEHGPDGKQARQAGVEHRRKAPSTNVRQGMSGPAAHPDGGAAKGLSLGIYAETYSRLDWQGLQPRSEKQSSKDKTAQKEGDHRLIRAERFALKAAAGKLLRAKHATKKCMKWRAPGRQLQVLHGATTGKAFYSGLQVCGRPWTCPVCASKISERRKHEVAHGISQAENYAGLKVYLLTLTVPHGIGDDLKAMLAKITKAWTWMWQGKMGTRAKDALGLVGTIRALEVTYGVNGWHPHIHALLFINPQQVTPEGIEAVGTRWQTACVKAGLPMPDLIHGWQIEGGGKAAAYVSKGVWGLESEVTKGHVKKGARGSRTPFDLLRGYREGDKQSGALWASYALAFEGKRQLYWSNGLRKLLNIAEAEKSDHELAEEQQDAIAFCLALITDEQWKIITRRRLESTVLDMAEVSADVLRLYLGQLRDT